MNAEEDMIFRAQTERLREIEGWLAMLIVRHGDANGTGWEYVMPQRSAQIMRDALPRPELNVSIEYDFTADEHVLVAL